MSRRHGETRRAILNVAERLLQERGYHGFSFHDVASELRLRKAAVHYHFPAKADLGVAVMVRFREDFAWWREQVAGRVLTGADRLEQYFRLDGRYAVERRVCPLGVVGVELAGVPGPMCAEAQSLAEDILAFLDEALVDGVEDGSLSRGRVTRHSAIEVLAATQGALQLARLSGCDAYDATVRSLREALFSGTRPADA